MMEPIELKIRPSLEWAAMDGDGSWWGYEDKPIERDMWWGDGGESCGLDAFDIPKYNGDFKDSLHQIIDGKLVKYIDVPGDKEKVIVGANQYRRYSSGKLDGDGRLLCYTAGDKWSSDGERTGWYTWRRPTPEEEAE